MNKLAIGIVIFILVGGAAFFMFSGRTLGPTTEDQGALVSPSAETPQSLPPAPQGGTAVNVQLPDTEETPGSVPTSSSAIKEFTVSGKSFSFTPAEIRVKKGDTVRITFTNENGMHDWRLDEFEAATKVIKAGEEETIEFVAVKTGTFEYYCSVGEHRARGMVGKFIVE